MDSKDNNEHISNGDGAGVGVGGDYNEFTSYLSGDILPSPPPPSASSWAWAWASTTDDAAPTRDIETGAVPDRPLNPSSLTTDQPPSSNDNGNGASDATRSAPAPDNIRPRQTSPAPLVMEGAHFEEQDDYAPVPPEIIAASFEAVMPELINEVDASVHYDQIAASFEAQDDEEEKREEDEDEDAPLPPETIAALFEEACKPELINEDYAPAPPDMIAGAFEGYDDEEEKREEDEDEDAPLPPETIAALFEEACKQELINEDDARAPPDMIAGAVEGYDNEEEKREEDEDGDAPLPPEMIAELFEAGDDVKQQAAKIPRMIEASTDENVNRVRDNINSIDQRGTDMPDRGADSLHEVVDNNDSPVSRESSLYPSSMSSQQH